MESNPIQTEKEKRYNEWRVLIEQQEQSGLSQIEFCKQRGLIVSKFGYYKSVIKPKNNIDHNQKLLFSPVRIKNHDFNKASEIKIILPNSIQCVFSAEMDVMQIKSLIEVLLSC